MSDPQAESIRVRTHGDHGPMAVALHGGPAGRGSAGPLARGLAGAFRVIEPWQRRSGAEPLSVARHVADLATILDEHCPDERPALVGESWGAMLALAFAARYPQRVAAIALVGCGTFDVQARSRLQETLTEREQAGGVDQQLVRITAEASDPGERMRRSHAAMERIYEVDPLPPDPADETGEPFDLRGHTETWDDMVARQKAGDYPDAFAQILCPVLLVQGDYDPHPGAMIRDGLLPHLPQLEYIELPDCGHTPARERRQCDAFFALLSEWLAKAMA